MAKGQNMEFYSPQLARYDNGRQILEFNERLHPASVQNAYKLHAGTDERAPNGAAIKSGVNVAIVDYTEKPVRTAKAFLSVEDVEWLWWFIGSDKLGEALALVKVHDFAKDAQGFCPVQAIQVERAEKDFQGRPYKLRWMVKISNGTAKSFKKPTGQIGYDKTTYRKENEFFVRLSERDIFNLLSKVTRAIRVWETANGIPLINAQEQEKQEERVKKCG